MKMHQGLRYAEAVISMLSQRFENAGQEAYANVWRSSLPVLVV